MVESINPKNESKDAISYLNINTKKVKKQHTLSTNRGQNSKKEVNKMGIKKMDTRTSKWSTNIKKALKDAKSPNRSKTIERKFTLSSSISSIR